MNTVHDNENFSENVFSHTNRAALQRFNLIATFVMTVYSYWLASGRTWSATHTDANQFGADFFRNQADAMLHGRLNVPFSGYSWTECVMMQGKCFGYFGVFPSVLRIPEFILTGARTENHIPVYVALAVGICFWASLDLFIRVMRAAVERSQSTTALSQRVLLLGALLIGPASVLVFLSEPAVYEEAILWAVAMTMVALNMTCRWTESQRHTHLILAVLAGIASANSRFSAVPVTVVIGGYLLFRRYRTGRMGTDRLGQRLEAALMIAPIATYVVVMYAKFGQFSAPADATTYYNDPIMVAIRESNGGAYTGPRFVPTNLAQFLRPDSLRFSSTYPWVRFSVATTDGALILPPLSRAGTMADHAISITNTMFAQLALTVGVAVTMVKSALHSRKLELPLVLLIASAGQFGPALVIYSNTARYTGDFYPFLIFGSILGIAALVMTDQLSVVLKRVVLDVGITAALASCFIWYILQVNRW